MSTEETRTLWEKFKAADQAHDAAAMNALYAEDVQAGPAFGKAAMVAFTNAAAEGFTEHREYRTVVISENAVAFTWHLRIQNTGPWMGNAPTGRSYEGDGATFLTVRGGLISKIEAFGVQEAIADVCPPNSPAAMVRRIYEESNANPLDMAFILDVYAPEFLHNGRETTATGWKQLAESIYSAFPDAQQEITDLSVEGDRVWDRYVMRGTHTRDLRVRDRVISASGRPFEVWGMEVRRIKDGRIVELWSSDVMSQLLPQLAG